MEDESVRMFSRTRISRSLPRNLRNVLRRAQRPISAPTILRLERQTIE